MKKVLKMIKMIVCIAVISLSVSCSKNDKMEFTNLTGKSFYGCQIWFRNSLEGDLVGYEEAGNVLMGARGKVRKLGSYCYVYAKDATGRMIMTKTVKAYDGMSFSRYDLY